MALGLRASLGVLKSVPFISVYGFMPVPHGSHHYSSVVLLGIRDGDSSSIIFIAQVCLFGYLSSVCFF